MRPLDAIGVPPVLILVIVVLAMIGLSLAIHKWFEEPSRRFILKATEGMVARVSVLAPWLDYAPARPSLQVSHGPADPAA
ncbi:MAG: hypothetical protein WDM92_12115 [Caulobacteraceae bacterium]